MLLKFCGGVPLGEKCLKRLRWGAEVMKRRLRNTALNTSKPHLKKPLKNTSVKSKITPLSSISQTRILIREASSHTKSNEPEGLLDFSEESDNL